MDTSGVVALLGLVVAIPGGLVALRDLRKGRQGLQVSDTKHSSVSYPSQPFLSTDFNSRITQPPASRHEVPYLTVATFLLVLLRVPGMLERGTGDITPTPAFVLLLVIVVIIAALVLAQSGRTAGNLLLGLRLVRWPTGQPGTAFLGAILRIAFLVLITSFGILGILVFIPGSDGRTLIDRMFRTATLRTRNVQ